MATAFKVDVDGDAQVYLRNPVNGILNPFSSSIYPAYCRTDPMTTFDRDPLLAHPSFYGTIAGDSVPNSLHVRQDAIALGNEYGNIIRCRYGNHTLGGLVGGGTGYFACKDILPTTYNPSTDPEVDKLMVGQQGNWYGYSNGPPVDDNVAGTDSTVGSINGLNTTNDRVRLSNWGCDYCGTNSENRLYFRLNRSNRSANGWAITLYNQAYEVIGSSLIATRAEVSNGYAYVMVEPFDLSPYVGQMVYIRIRATPPPLSVPSGIVSAQRATLSARLNEIGYIGGTLFRSGPGSLYQSAWAVVAGLANAPIVDLTTYAVTGPTLPSGTNRFFVGTGNGFTGFSDGGGVDDGVAGTNATCGLLDGANITDRSVVGNWICNYFGSNSSGFLYIRLRDANNPPADISLTLYDEQYGIIVVGKLENRGPADAWYLPTPFNLTPYLNRTIFVKVTSVPLFEPS